MRQTKGTILIFVLLLAYSCIKPYIPQIKNGEESKYVILGKITDIEGWQVVDISLSSPIEDPAHIPVSGCSVRILDDKGNSFSLSEYDPGRYRIWLEQKYLVPGTAYKVTVITPQEEMIESSYDTLYAGAPLDSVYFILEDMPTSDPSVFRRGIQFYVDLNAGNIPCRFFKWDVVETWEFHSAFPVEYYYDGEFHQVDPPDYSNNVCWTSGRVKNVYTVSTKNLSQNSFEKYPLHFVDGKSSRLSILYSILVSQHALGANAYNYWEQVRIKNSEQGGLYEKQPFAIKGNLNNTTNPDNEVRGYFYAASESSKRYFYENVQGLELDFTNYCNEDILGHGGWRQFTPSDYPVYYHYNLNHGLRILNNECVDCRLMGGSTTKPDFWPK
ncbi:MAG TPA: DUF4249 domain-containing protein [Bacteroidales bacterium]|nr:DUF4249 domain-containing protein [Bacteroidales bacterium]